MCFAQKKTKIKSNEKVQKIKREVYEKFMKRKHIYDTTVSITPDYLVEMILKNKSISNLEIINEDILKTNLDSFNHKIIIVPFQLISEIYFNN